MEPFTILTAVAAPLLRDNVDTDAIIPSREMRTVTKRGLADGLFAGWRYRTIGGRDPDPNFVLNDPAHQGARILIAGANFGCGSSREHAVWALAEYGFRAVIAASFNPIFRGNCIANGVLPVVLPQEALEELAGIVADPDTSSLTVDLVAQEVRSGARRWPFVIAADAREALLAGLDPIDQTLNLIGDIRRFVDADRGARPWAYSSLRDR